jgi:glycosyltransferase involved in cell wall biosynthesis
MASKANKSLIVMDARMHRHSGIGTFIQNLTPLLASRLPRARWLALLPDEVRPSWMPPDFDTVSCPAPLYSLREHFTIPSLVPGETALFWSPHYAIPWKLPCPLAVTVHDLNHLARSPSLLQNPVRHLYPRILFGRVARQAEHIFCVSEFTRDEFLKAYPHAADKTSCIHNGVHPDWFKTCPAPPPFEKPYLLFVGTVRPHKNLGTLLQAFSQRSSPDSLDLVIAGPRQAFRSPDPEALKLASRLGSSVHFVDDASTSALQVLMRHALALVFPSFYEGFGLPVLEALASGCPVLCSDLPPLREIADSLPLYFDPSSVPDLLAKIEAVRGLTGEERSGLIREGKVRAESFTWEKTADMYSARFLSLMKQS